jgi:hypothetical protein
MRDEKVRATVQTSDTVKLADVVVSIAEQLKDELQQKRPRGEVFQEIFTLRRSLERLEQEVREAPATTLGEAC